MQINAHGKAGRLRASFLTLGCRLNQAETALIANHFSQNGYEIVDFAARADVCVINSCTVTEQADAKCRQVIRQVLRRNPDTFIAVTGCYAQMGAAALQCIEGIDLIVGSQDKLSLLQHIDEPSKRPSPVIVRGKMSRAPFTIDIDATHLPTTRANLKIQEGCDFMCTFCIIPFARGRARSRAFWDIQREAMALVEAGYRELVVTGVNIGTYAFEGKSFLDVVKMLLAIPGLERLRISSIEPTTIPEELFELIAGSDVLCPHLHIPLQSGSDRILQAMRRLYSAGDFRRFIDTAAARVPDILIGTDLMVGFPGEDEVAFADTCALLENSPLAYAHVFTFSERPGTAAERLAGKVDAKIKKIRSKQLHALSEQKKAQFYQRFVGRHLRILTEELDSEGRWLGFSDNYIKVAVPAAELQANQLTDVQIATVRDGLALAA